MTRYQAILAALLLPLPLVSATESPSHIRVQTFLVEMPLVTYSSLLNHPLAPPIYKATQRLIREKKARIINSEIVIARSDENATIESVRKFMYPSEVYGSGLSGSFTPEDTRLQSYVNAGHRYLLPSNETRNLGSTLTISPVITGKNINLNFYTEWVSMPSMNTLVTFKDRWGNADMKTPHFFTIRAGTSCNLTNDQYLLVSTHAPLGAKGKPDYSRKLLLFVKATIIHPSASP